MAGEKQVDIQQLRQTAAWHAQYNLILKSGQVAWESDTGRSKTGDGITHWNNLPYNTAYSRLVIAAGNELLSTPSAGTTRLAWTAALRLLFGTAEATAKYLYAAAADQPYKWNTSIQPIYNYDGDGHVSSIDFEGVFDAYFKIIIS